jgi:hypothetical protein
VTRPWKFDRRMCFALLVTPKLAMALVFFVNIALETSPRVRRQSSMPNRLQTKGSCDISSTCFAGRRISAKMVCCMQQLLWCAARCLQKQRKCYCLGLACNDEEIAARVVVFETLAGAGIPISKLDDKDILMIQKDGSKLGGRHGVVEVMPFVVQRHKDLISKAVAGHGQLVL